MPRNTPTGSLCVVNIGFHVELLMPVNKGLELVKLLQSSVVVKTDYTGRGATTYYVAQGVPEVMCSTIRAEQVRRPTDPARTLTHNPSEVLL